MISVVTLIVTVIYSNAFGLRFKFSIRSGFKKKTHNNFKSENETHSLNFNSISHRPKKLFSLLQWKPFKNDQKLFLFNLKALFILKIFEFLSWFFGHGEKMVWLEIKS